MKSQCLVDPAMRWSVVNAAAFFLEEFGVTAFLFQLYTRLSENLVEFNQFDYFDTPEVFPLVSYASCVYPAVRVRRDV